MKLTSFVLLLLFTAASTRDKADSTWDTTASTGDTAASTGDTAASTEDAGIEAPPKKEGIKLGKVKAPVAKTPKTVIDDVDEDGLHQVLDEHEHVAVLFYSSLDKLTKKYILEMEQMDSNALDIEVVR